LKALLPALGCLLLGVGCFKGNIAAQVGDLYAPGDRRRASAFQIFMLAVQVAVIAAPLVCGTLGERVGWHWGFGSAGVGMLIGLFVYLRGRRWLPPEPARSAADARAPAQPIGRRGDDAGRPAGGHPAVLMLSIVGNQQFNNAYPLWSQQHMDMSVGGFEVPVTWLQAVDALVSTITMIWARSPSGAGGPRAAPSRRDHQDLAGLLRRRRCTGPAAASGLRHRGRWRQDQHPLDLCLHPGQRHRLRQHHAGGAGAVLTRRTARVQGVMIGIYYLHLFFGNTFVGWLAGLLETMPGSQFWGLHAVLVASAGVGLLLVKLVFGRVLAPEEATAQA
jgi:POT family proton-dependent oligopeptide transporter